MRIAIQQPALPAYRVPLFRILSEALPEHELTIYYGSEEPLLKNAQPDGFASLLSGFRQWRFPVLGEFRWHGIQWQLVNGRRADLVVLSWNVRVLSLWLALLRARFNNVPVILWGHGYSKTNTNVVFNWIRSVPVKLASAVIFYDDLTATEFVRNNQNVSVSVAHNGLDSIAIQKVREAVRLQFPKKCDAQKYLGIGPGPVLLYVGRLMADNRLDLLIGSLPVVLQQHPDCRLVIVGDGDAEKDVLTQMLESSGLQTNVVWVGSLYTEHELAPWMLAADLFVYPCNVGLSLVHAFNYALPAVICGPLSRHNPEVAIVEAGTNTVLASEASSTSLSEAIVGALEVPENTKLMGNRALAKVLATHNVDNMVNAFVKAFSAFNNDGV